MDWDLLINKELSDIQNKPITILDLLIHLPENKEARLSLPLTSSIEDLIKGLENNHGLNFLEFYERSDKTGWFFTYRDKNLPISKFFSNTNLGVYAFKTQYSIDVLQSLPSELNVYNAIGVKAYDIDQKQNQEKIINALKNTLSNTSINRKDKILHILAHDIIFNPKIRSKISDKGIYDIKTNILSDFSFEYLLFLLDFDNEKLFQTKMRFAEKPDLVYITSPKLTESLNISSIIDNNNNKNNNCNTSIYQGSTDDSNGVGGGMHDNTLLYWAAKMGNLPLTEFLLFTNQGGHINDRKILNGNTALHIAALFQHQSIVKLLLECGAEKKRVNNDGMMPQNMTKSSKITDCFRKYENHPIYKTLKNLRIRDKIKYVRSIRDHNSKIVTKKARLASFSPKYGYQTMWYSAKLEYLEELLCNVLDPKQPFKATSLNTFSRKTTIKLQGEFDETDLGGSIKPQALSKKPKYSEPDNMPKSARGFKDIKGAFANMEYPSNRHHLESMPSSFVGPTLTKSPSGNLHTNKNNTGLTINTNVSQDILSKNGIIAKSIHYFLVHSNTLQKINVALFDNWYVFLELRILSATMQSSKELQVNKKIYNPDPKPRRDMRKRNSEDILNASFGKYTLEDDDIVIPYSLWLVKEGYWNSIDAGLFFKDVKKGAKVTKGDYNLLTDPNRLLVQLRLVPEKRKILLEADRCSNFIELAYFICQELDFDDTIAEKISFFRLNQMLDKNLRIEQYFIDHMSDSDPQLLILDVYYQSGNQKRERQEMVFNEFELVQKH